MNSKRKFTLFVSFLVISLIIAIFSTYSGSTLSSLEKFFSGNHLLSTLLYSLLFVVLAVFSFSVAVMTSLGVFLFSGYEVVIYAMIGIMGSSIIHFFISRKLGKSYVRNYLEKRKGNLEKFDSILEKDSFKTIFILSAIFFVPPTMPNLLGGIMNINLKKYFIATFLGNFPNTFFTVYLINGLLYSNTFQIYVSTIGLVMTSLIALYFYNGEIRDILRLSFPWIVNKNPKNIKTS